MRTVSTGTSVRAALACSLQSTGVTITGARVKYSDIRREKCHGTKSTESSDLDGVDLFSNTDLVSFERADHTNAPQFFRQQLGATIRFDSIQFQFNLFLSHHYKSVSKVYKQSVFRSDT